MYHMTTRDLVAAHRDIDTAISLCPSNAVYLSQLALLYDRETGRHFDASLVTDMDVRQRALSIKAATLYGQALSIVPTDDLWLHNMGWLYWYDGEPSEAERCLRRSIALEPTIPLYHVSLGLMAEANGDRGVSASEFRTAILLNPGLLDSMFYKDLSRRRPEAQQWVEEAAHELEHSSDRLSTAQMAKLGRLYLHLGRLKEARQLLATVTNEHPTFSRAWLTRGDVERISGETAQARESYRKAHYIDPQDASILYRLAETSEVSDSAQSVSYYRRAMSRYRAGQSTHKSFWLYWQPAASDDVVPEGLLMYVSPELNVARACAAILTRSEGTANAACDDLQAVVSR
jgi:tetratricopeptide (TPR) repeat protein